MALHKDKFKVVVAGGSATCTYEDGNAFLDTDITKEQITAVQKHMKSYIAECAIVAGDKAISIMDEDPSVNTVELNFPYGAEKVGKVTEDSPKVVVTAKRTVTFHGMKINGTGEKRPDTTRSDLRVVVKDPFVKVPKKLLSDIHSKMTKELLD